jgi:hypothetical protein
MKRFPSNLSEEDLRTYRRWTRGVYLSYLAAVIVAVAVTFLRAPAVDLRASNEIQIARMKAPSASIDASAPTRSAAKP